MNAETKPPLFNRLSRSFISDDAIMEWRTIEGQSEYALVRSSRLNPKLIRAALKIFKHGIIKTHPYDETVLKHITRPVFNRLASLPIFGHKCANIRPVNGEIPGLIPQPFSNEAELIGHKDSHWVVQNKRPEKLVLYVPGGGYVIGSCATHRPLTTPLVKHLNSNVGVLVANHRHAPQASYKEALEDVMAVYDHVIESWGYAPDQVLLAGDSAGANLAFCFLQDLMKANKPLPRAMVGLSGIYDPTQVLERNEKCSFVCPETTKKIFNHVFHMHTSDYDTNYNLAEILKRLSSYKHSFQFYLQSGTHETFVTESIQLKKTADSFNVSVTLDCFDRMGHIFQIFPTRESEQALKAVTAFINECFVSL